MKQKNHTRANVNYLSGLIDKKQLEESDKERMLSYASGIFQVMTALSVGFSSALSPQTLAKSLLLDGALNLGQAILDPKNMVNIADGKGIKDIGFNIILSGSITFFLSTDSSPKVGKSFIQGNCIEVIFDPEKNKFSARTADGKIHDLVPVKSEGNNLTFKIGNSEETIKLSIDKEKIAIENKPAKPVSNATPKNKQELGNTTSSAAHASTGTTVKSDTSADIHVEPHQTE